LGKREKRLDKLSWEGGALSRGLPDNVATQNPAELNLIERLKYAPRLRAVQRMKRADRAPGDEGHFRRAVLVISPSSVAAMP
jgi:hypothetical protein